MTDKKIVPMAVNRLSAEFNATAALLPLGIRQGIVERLLETRQIFPAEGVSRADIMQSLEQSPEAPLGGVRQVLTELVKKGLVKEGKPLSTHKPA